MAGFPYPEVIGDDDQTPSVPGLKPGQQIRTGTEVARTLYAAAPPATVAAGAQADFLIEVQVPMRLDQLIIVDDTVGPVTAARVTGIRVGPNNQIVSNGGALPARMFAPESFNTNVLQGNTAAPGVNIIVTIQNPTVAPATYVVGCKGVALTRG